MAGSLSVSPLHSHPAGHLYVDPTTTDVSVQGEGQGPAN